MPFGDDSFDVVYGAWLPHVLTSNPQFLDEIARVSRKHILLIMPGTNDDIVTMKSIVFPGERKRREEYRRQVSTYLKSKGMKISYKETDLKLDSHLGLTPQLAATTL